MGYWAKLAAGRKAARFPLPARLPGQSDEIVMGGDQRRWRWPAELDVTQVPEPPVFTGDLDQQVAATVKRIGRVVATRDLGTPDRALAKVLEAESKRRAQHASETYSWHKPHFDEPVFQRHLRLFNSIARALAPVYGTQGVSEGNEWFQGRGTVHHLTLHLSFGGSGMYMRVHEPGEARRDRAPAPVNVSTLRVESGALEEPLLEWTDRGDRKLEAQLTEIVAGTVRRAEERLRWYKQACYERECDVRNEELEAIERRRVEAERKRLEAIVVHQTKVRAEVIGLAKRRRQAEDIRATVTALRSHPEVSTADGSAKFSAWASHALRVADEIDPMSCSLEEVLENFMSPSPAPD